MVYNSSAELIIGSAFPVLQGPHPENTQKKQETAIKKERRRETAFPISIVAGNYFIAALLMPVIIYFCRIRNRKTIGMIAMTAPPNGALAMTRKNNKVGFETPNTQIVKFVSVGRMDDLELAGWLGTLNLRGDHQLIVDALKIIDPDIVDIQTVVQQRYTQLYLITKDSSIPLKLAGDGICKLLYCVLYVLCNQNSIVLIDEIENGFHYSMQESFWNTLAKAAKKSNTQIIATTHSYECIKHAVDGIANAGMQDKFSLHRIDRIGEENRATQYSGELVKDAVDSLMEVR